jgi:hypothetical protein
LRRVALAVGWLGTRRNVKRPVADEFEAFHSLLLEYRMAGVFPEV